MGQLVCELCGSSDFVKESGYCKYTVEEARELMTGESKVQIEGTVQVDNTDQIINYMKLAENALGSQNNQEAESYANKIIEIDPTNSKAWYIKGCAAGWQSTLANIRLGESAECWSNAIKYAKDSEVEQYTRNSENELYRLIEAMMNLKAANFINYSSESNGRELSDNTQLIVPLRVLSNSGVRINVNRIKKMLYKKIIDSADKVVERDSTKMLSTYVNRYEWQDLMTTLDVCCIIYEGVASGTDDEKVVRDSFNKARAIQQGIISSRSYYEDGYGGYNNDQSLTPDAIRLRNNRIYEYNNLESKNVQRAQKAKKENERIEREYREAERKLKEEKKKQERLLELQKTSKKIDKIDDIDYLKESADFLSGMDKDLAEVYSNRLAVVIELKKKEIDQLEKSCTKDSLSEAIKLCSSIYHITGEEPYSDRKGKFEQLLEKEKKYASIPTELPEDIDQRLDVIEKLTDLSGYKDADERKERFQDEFLTELKENADDIGNIDESSVSGLLQFLKAAGQDSLYDVYKESSSERKYLNTVKAMDNAENEDAYKALADSFSELQGYKDSDEMKKKCLDKAEECRKRGIVSQAAELAGSNEIPDMEKSVGLLNGISGFSEADNLKREIEDKISAAKDKIYDEAAELLATGEKEKIEQAIPVFEGIKDWKDSGEQIVKCQHKLEEIDISAKKKRRTIIIIAIVIAAVICAGFLVIRQHMEKKEQERIQQAKIEKVKELEPYMKKITENAAKITSESDFYDSKNVYCYCVKENGTVYDVYCSVARKTTGDPVTVIGDPKKDWNNIVAVSSGYGIKKNGSVVRYD